MKIYHGSNAIVEKPEILKEGHFKDFGFGFYCTAIKRQAMKWALSKQGKHVVNTYDYRENTPKDFDYISISGQNEKKKKNAQKFLDGNLQ